MRSSDSRSSLLLLVVWGCSLLLGCASSNPGRAPGIAPEPPSPIPEPHPGNVGCVEPRDLKAYVLGLEADRKARREAALRRLGGEWTRRTGEYLPPGSRALGETFESEGRARAVAAYQARNFPPETELARVGRTLHRVQERPRPHPVAIVGCGTRACPTRPQHGGATERSPASPLAIELSPGETWGEPLALDYDFWWAQVSHHHLPDCPPASTGAAGSPR